MLEKILKDLYVDPELLSGLDECQKQTLFCKMREEQVRRWYEWDAQCSAMPRKDTPTTAAGKPKKHVTFLHGSDGEPWVWVMGEHENDRSIDEILRDEAIEKARELAEREAEALRDQLIVCLAPSMDEDIYCSVEEAGKLVRADLHDNRKRENNNNNYTIGHYQNALNNSKHNVIESNNALNELNRSASKKVAAKVAQWEQRLTEERTSEILKNIQRKRQLAAKEAEENARNDELLWKEQERRAKEAEQQMREIARKAREEHRLTASEVDLEAATVPSSRQAVVTWYQQHELPRRAGLDKDEQVEPYFHGLITRSEAESLLQNQPDGTYLVRLTERLWGYTISHKSHEKFKHYLVSAGEHYSFLGRNQLDHRTLGDLISYHKEHPLSGGEKLMNACPRRDQSAIGELFPNA